jgi:hypothetical protein
MDTMVTVFDELTGYVPSLSRAVLCKRIEALRPLHAECRIGSRSKYRFGSALVFPPRLMDVAEITIMYEGSENVPNLVIANCPALKRVEMNSNDPITLEKMRVETSKAVTVRSGTRTMYYCSDTFSEMGPFELQMNRTMLDPEPFEDNAALDKAQSALLTLPNLVGIVEPPYMWRSADTEYAALQRFGPVAMKLYQDVWVNIPPGKAEAIDAIVGAALDKTEGRLYLSDHREAVPMSAGTKRKIEKLVLCNAELTSQDVGGWLDAPNLKTAVFDARKLIPDNAVVDVDGDPNPIKVSRIEELMRAAPSRKFKFVLNHGKERLTFFKTDRGIEQCLD